MEIMASLEERFGGRFPEEILPEIDGLVYIEERLDARPGDRLSVMVTAADEHDLYAEPVK